MRHIDRVRPAGYSTGMPRLGFAWSGYRSHEWRPSFNLYWRGASIQLIYCSDVYGWTARGFRLIPEFIRYVRRGV